MIRVVDLVGEDALTREDGLQIYEMILEAVKSDKIAQVDFAGVRTFSSPFFNAAVGQLLREWNADFLDSHVRFVHIPASAELMMSRVRENAIDYYRGSPKKSGYDHIRDMLQEQEDE